MTCDSKVVTQVWFRAAPHPGSAARAWVESSLPVVAVCSAPPLSSLLPLIEPAMSFSWVLLPGLPVGNEQVLGHRPEPWAFLLPPYPRAHFPCDPGPHNSW